jgi:hypothetical protein
LSGEAIGVESLKLCTNEDLTELGFVLGHRKLILKWIVRNKWDQLKCHTQLELYPSHNTIIGLPIASTSTAPPVPSTSGQSLCPFKVS